MPDGPTRLRRPDKVATARQGCNGCHGHSDIELPTQINKTDGYHRQCYSSFTALMSKYRDLSSETDYGSNSTSLTLSPSTPVDISETVPRNVTQSSYIEVASSSLDIQTKSGDFELNLNSKITPEDVAPSSNNQSISRHPDLDFNREISSENAASNLDSQTTLEDVASSSTCDLSINETNDFNEIPDTNIEDIGKERQLKNVCFFCDKDRKQNKGQIYEDLLEYQNKKISLPPSASTDLIPNEVLSELLNSYKRYLQDVTAELQPNRIKIYGKQIADFIEILKANCNPFNPQLDKENLYNIATSKPASPEVADFLLNIQENDDRVLEDNESSQEDDMNDTDKDSDDDDDDYEDASFFL
ncbi:unnamed protein product [Arctia plantaginis]|uniref:Uncharacterized protein n=1 Tax=Arctia plantaginis TaxID=874455 RepID=A0A8S0ZUY3_ARCPL|nr:unnamed protein product [Arctia plantaginis]